MSIKGGGKKTNRFSTVNIWRVISFLLADDTLLCFKQLLTHATFKKQTFWAGATSATPFAFHLMSLVLASYSHIFLLFPLLNIGTPIFCKRTVTKHNEIAVGAVEVFNCKTESWVDSHFAYVSQYLWWDTFLFTENLSWQNILDCFTYCALNWWKPEQNLLYNLVCI